MSTAFPTVYVEPVVRTVRVRATTSHAFDVFVARMGRWWAPTHSINATGAALADVVVEPRVGGRWYEAGVDGSTCDWGRVIAWDPPRRVVLAWQLDAAFRYDPAFETEVEVRFDADGDRTVVTLEHRRLERLGDAAHGLREALGGDGGWGGLLERFRAFADGS